MIFSQIIYQIPPYARDFVPVNFFKIFTLKTILPAIEKCTVKWGAWKCISRGRRGRSGVSLARHFSQTSKVTYLFGYIFRNRHWQGTFKERLKKLSDNFFFLRNHLNRSEWEILTAVNIDFNQSNYSVCLLSILSRHNLIMILFIRTIMHHQEKIMGWLFSLLEDKNDAHQVYKCDTKKIKKSNLYFEHWVR